MCCWKHCARYLRNKTAHREENHAMVFLPVSCFMLFYLSSICQGRSLDCACFHHDLAQLFGIDGFMQSQCPGDTVKRRTMFGQQTNGTRVGPLHDTINLFINDSGRLLTVLTSIVRECGTRERVFTLTKGDGAKPFAHTPTGDHLPCNGCDTLEVVLRSRRNMPYGYL